MWLNKWVRHVPDQVASGARSFDLTTGGPTHYHWTQGARRFTGEQCVNVQAKYICISQLRHVWCRLLHQNTKKTEFVSKRRLPNISHFVEAPVPFYWNDPLFVTSCNWWSRTIMKTRHPQAVWDEIDSLTVPMHICNGRHLFVARRLSVAFEKIWKFQSVMWALNALRLPLPQ